MTNRKKNILLIQGLIFIIAVLLIYYTYGNKNRSEDKKTSNVIIKENINNKTDEKKSNTFENVKYRGVDLNGNRYEIKSEIANFEVDSPELINMKIMSAIFYFKDGSILKIRGDYGTYNNKTNNMKFRENIKAEHKDSYLFADNLDFLNTENLLTIYGNVRTESIQGNIRADNLEFDISKQTLDISMFSKKQISVKLNNQ